ncbi:nucleotidyltransferase domain-containing protein [Sphingomonas sp. CGMCC 1.13654]|uniref:Nucleotidyltransferase domain-containing protein n=1 Tax=Sphingomonas chungangi TaxID=2683589 RepID=A0A838L7G0_9SPHN|nr:nucleotidyltransferase and HEPN domain-containing protein [Sphingomonas chungangi]MBA2934632.1 nucleotidyltransferase domain-containing protein [Sphingomonas chungangi]MVW57667.1 HEPN domain-containing protein [Sphingomonas chungangi]
MRTDLDHLPHAKQRELERVIHILFEEFEAAKARATGERKRGKILKIILYGSYARGGWVDEPHTAKGYLSDFDLLVIVNQRELAEREQWVDADERLTTDLVVNKTLHTPVNFIVHSLQQVNDGLAHGRFFFMDIVGDGIALYQSDDTPLHTPKPKTPEEALAAAKEYFDEWMTSAVDFKDGFDFYMSKRRWKKASFLLHQTAESLYHGVMLVSTFYTPHNHNLSFLRKQAEKLDRRLYDVWPRDDRKQRAMFEKLKEAYVKARYSKHYVIGEEELTWLGERVEQLGQVVHAISSERIELLAKDAG